MMRLMVPAFCALFLGAADGQAANVRDLGKFRNWNAASFDADSSRNCFIISNPVNEKPSNLNHGEVFFFVTAKGGATTESSFQTGYAFAKDSTVRLTIGDETFQMFTNGSSAWLRRVEREAALLAAMKAGETMVLDATSARGNDTSYTFSLEGVTAASRMLDRCR